MSRFLRSALVVVAVGAALALPACTTTDKEETTCAACDGRGCEKCAAPTCQACGGKGCAKCKPR